MLLARDEGFRVDARKLSEFAQEGGGREDADRRLQVRSVELLAERPAEFPVEADVEVGVGQARNVLDMGPKREGQVDLAADALDDAPDLVEVRGHVERAVDRPDDVDPWLGALGLRRLAAGLGLLGPELVPQPRDGAVGRLPLVLVDGAGQEAQQVRAFGRDPAADHLGDRARHDYGRHVGVLRGAGAAQGALGAGHRQLVLRKAGNDDRQLVRRQAVGVMQYRRHRQILAADGAVDDDAQAPQRREGVDGAPISSRAVVIENQHG